MKTRVRAASPKAKVKVNPSPKAKVKVNPSPKAKAKVKANPGARATLPKKKAKRKMTSLRSVNFLKIWARKRRVASI